MPTPVATVQPLTVGERDRGAADAGTDRDAERVGQLQRCRRRPGLSDRGAGERRDRERRVGEAHAEAADRPGRDGGPRRQPGGDDEHGRGAGRDEREADDVEAAWSDGPDSSAPGPSCPRST